MSSLGIVVIGRNEGERLRRCLQSVAGRGHRVVYVDSASRDGSVALARELGVGVAELDPAQGLSAARARNLGFERLLAADPDLALVQFVDGDCELHPEWLAAGERALAEDPARVLVSGVLHELHPEASRYNRLCALEWQKPAGAIDACGGLFLVRARAFAAAGGFRGDVVAGEEGELCLRLRRAGGVLWQSAAPMAWHDAAMFRFGQWWQRAKRGGLAYAQGAALHGAGPERHCVRDVRRILLWGLALPVLALALAWPTYGLSLLLFGLYPLQAFRIARYGQRRGWSPADARLYALFTVLDKFPAVLGIASFHWRRLRGRAVTIVEHKGPA
jgi:GT2 family glycosyltransferase